MDGYDFVCNSMDVWICEPLSMDSWFMVYGYMFGC